MGHYSDYYDMQAEEDRQHKRELYKRALKDLSAYRQYNAEGKTGTWTFIELGLEKDYGAMLDRIKARLYELGDR